MKGRCERTELKPQPPSHELASSSQQPSAPSQPRGFSLRQEFEQILRTVSSERPCCHDALPAQPHREGPGTRQGPLPGLGGVYPWPWGARSQACSAPDSSEERCQGPQQSPQPCQVLNPGGIRRICASPSCLSPPLIETLGNCTCHKLIQGSPRARDPSMRRAQPLLCLSSLQAGGEYLAGS